MHPEDNEEFEKSYKAIQELCDAGAELISQESGSHEDDGGIWNAWIYELPDGTFWKVYQACAFSPPTVVLLDHFDQALLETK